MAITGGIVCYLFAGVVFWIENCEYSLRHNLSTALIEFVWWVCFWPALLILKRLP